MKWAKTYLVLMTGGGRALTALPACICAGPSMAETPPDFRWWIAALIVGAAIDAAIIWIALELFK
ncbi:hypothetical protein [Blastomonas sp. CCH1-A6]|uniref:hypothetical protein n=1 Tax=Blastomonas sp. CCH1-A6 TaxID=1768762 RepID=UPI00082B3396